MSCGACKYASFEVHVTKMENEHERFMSGSRIIICFCDGNQGVECQNTVFASVTPPPQQGYIHTPPRAGGAYSMYS